MFSVDGIQQRINVVNKRHCTSHSSGLSQALVCAECCLQRKWLVTLDDKFKSSHLTIADGNIFTRVTIHLLTATLYTSLMP